MRKLQITSELYALFTSTEVRLGGSWGFKGWWSLIYLLRTLSADYKHLHILHTLRLSDNPEDSQKPAYEEFKEQLICSPD